MKYVGLSPDGRGRHLVTVEDTPLGRGGEGSVYSVLSHDIPNLPEAAKLVAKVYHEPASRKEKVHAMVQAAPESDSVAWPLAVINDQSNMFQGYLMVKLPSDSYRAWAELSHVSERKAASPDFDVLYGITAIRNLGIALDSIHHAGHCVGDVNESNIFVSADARIMIVDTDSAQIKSPDGTVFPCTVGKPEYTASELTHGSLRNHTRTVETDMFAYCVAAFQMLTGGAHPSDTVYKGNDDPPSIVEKIRQDIYPGLMPVSDAYKTVKRIPVSAIPLVFKNVFAKGLSSHAGDRPSFAKVIAAEKSIVDNLVQCKVEKLHWYDSREKECKWCVHAKTGAPDPWSLKKKSPAAGSQQTALPSLSFRDSDSQPQIRRAGPGAQPPSRRAAQQNSVPQPQASPNYGYQPPHSGHVSSPGIGQAGGPGLPPGFPGSQPNLGQPTPASPSRPQVPNKIKGKTVVQRADGTYVARPPLTKLLFTNPKLALHCFKNESPRVAQCWWSEDRPNVAHKVGIWIGLVLSFVLAFCWAWFIPQYEPHIKNFPMAGIIIDYLAYVAAGTAVLFSFILLYSILKDRRGVLQNLQPGRTIREANPLTTALQFVYTGVVYGPFLTVALVFGTVIGILKFVFAIFKAEHRR